MGEQNRNQPQRLIRNRQRHIDTHLRSSWDQLYCKKMSLHVEINYSLLYYNKIVIQWPRAKGIVFSILLEAQENGRFWFTD